MAGTINKRSSVRRIYVAARRDVMPAVDAIVEESEQSRGEFSRANSKTRTDDAGISIRWQLATFHLGLFSSPRSFRPAAPETLTFSIVADQQ
jgi:hypothetical protein